MDGEVERFKARMDARFQITIPKVNRDSGDLKPGDILYVELVKVERKKPNKHSHS